MKKIKPFHLFTESNTDINDIVSVVKDMLSELDFENIRHYILVDGETIQLNIFKSVEFSYDDIKDIIEGVDEYLESEGFHLIEEMKFFKSFVYYYKRK